jgi:hypothetical protein
VKNVKAGPMQLMICIALCLNIALSYVLMLAPSRQYLESALVITLTKRYPHLFARHGYDDIHSQQDLHESEEGVTTVSQPELLASRGDH